MSNFASVAETFKGKSFFITGASGFLGKVLIEKLFRETPDINKVYLLIRPLKEKTPEQRLEEILNGMLFDAVRTKVPNFWQRIIAVNGDLVKPNLGLQETDPLIEEVRQNVTFVIHCAATVNFNERLDISINTNVVSVYNLVQLARTLQKLEAFVHVSTAYAHCDRQHIGEVFYPPTCDPMALAEAIKTMPVQAIEAMTKPLLGKRPNTYTFTKSLAEAVLKAQAQGLPAAVVRPSVVGSIRSDPLPGWSDNVNGPAGFYLAAGHGIMKTAVANEKAVFDIVPVDHCINMILGVAWRLAVNPPSEPLVYNCVSSSRNPLRLDFHNALIQKLASEKPMSPKSRIGLSKVVVTNEFLYKWITNPLLHVLPAFAYDTYRRSLGKKPMMVRVYSRLNATIFAYIFFTTQGWTWDDTNSLALMKDLSDQDRKTYDIDIAKMDWATYLTTYYDGCKKFLQIGKPVKSSMSGAGAPLPSPGSSVANTPTASPSITPSSSSDNLFSKSTTELLRRGAPSSSEDLVSSSEGASSSSSSSYQSSKASTATATLQSKGNWNSSVFVSTIMLILLAVITIVIWDALVEPDSSFSLSTASSSLINKTSNPLAFFANLFQSAVDSK